MKTKIVNYPDLLAARNRQKSETIFLSASTHYLKEMEEIGKGKFYYIHTYGCQANVRDEETMRGMLESVNYQRVEDPSKADVIIINTCAVRENAEDKVYGEIGNLKKYRKTNKKLVLGICGCMVEEPEILQILQDKFPEVNLYFGTHEIDQLLDLIYEVYSSDIRLISIKSKQGEVIENNAVTRNNEFKAYVNIIYGCDKFCTYCIVPYTRGKERSRNKEDIIFEVKQLLDQGYKEICLLGQNVNAYGKDLKLSYTFGDLLNDVAKTGMPRIRFMTSHPWDFDDSMIQAIKNNPNIMPYIHLPIQSGNTEILKKMNRRYSREEYFELYDKLKAELPGFAFTTDIIVGFPNESDEAFEDTLSAVDHCEYDNAFTFISSPRSGTPAALMEDRIERSVKEERLQRLNEKVAYYANKNNQRFRDQIVEVLVDGVSKRNSEVYSGYTPENKLVNFTGEDIRAGEIVKVKIKEVMSFSLNGEKVDE